jgi:hypothetical protein
MRAFVFGKGKTLIYIGTWFGGVALRLSVGVSLVLFSIVFAVMAAPVEASITAYLESPVTGSVAGV